MVVLVLGACGGTDGATSVPTSQPDPVMVSTTALAVVEDPPAELVARAEAFVDAMIAGDAARSYEFADEACRARFSLEQWNVALQESRAVFEMMGPARWADMRLKELLVLEVDGDSAVLMYELEDSNGPVIDRHTGAERQPWILEGGQWRTSNCF